MTNSRPRYTPEEYRKRPREYDPRIADQIIERLRNGESLIEMCHLDRDLPLPGNFVAWTFQDPNLRAAYNQALEIQSEVFVDEMITLSDGPDAQRAKVQIDARRFAASSHAPERYGRGKDRGNSIEDAVSPDYGLEVRRKLEAMSQRIQNSQ